MRARLTAGPALPLVTPFERQDSALLRILTEADALLIRPLGDPARAAGDEVDYLPL
jgi:molybdopterin molybdotransferase